MFEFKVNGRSVRPQDIERELTNAMLNKAQHAIEQKLSAIRCPLHGQRARVSFQGRSADEMEYKVNGCCDALVQEVRRTLGQAS